MGGPPAIQNRRCKRPAEDKMQGPEGAAGPEESGAMEPAAEEGAYMRIG